jgi:hypothetical protein
MAFLDSALAQLLRKYSYNRDVFYGDASGLDLGAGLIYQDVIHPAYNDESQKYDTRAGAAYILTHECDVDPANDRHFNTEVLVLPIIRFEEFCEEYIAEHSEGALGAFIDNLAQDDVSRVMYIPPVPMHIANSLPSGGLLYLNNICSSPTSCFGDGSDGFAAPLCALSSYALNIVDLKLENHLRRPKAQLLPRLR